jgi:hypothetical protein
MAHGRVVCPTCNGVMLSCRCPGPHVDTISPTQCDECQRRELGRTPLIDAIITSAGKLAEEVLRLTNRCPLEIEITLPPEVWWRAFNEAGERRLVDGSEGHRGVFRIPTGRCEVVFFAERGRRG